MKFAELPQDVQGQLEFERTTLKHKCINTAYRIELYNEQGTRYFIASRCCQSWNDDKGNYMPFGGGSYWSIRYGAVQFTSYKSCVGTKEYKLCNGKCYRKSANGTEIPSRLSTKKDVLVLVKEIGIFTL